MSDDDLKPLLPAGSDTLRAPTARAAARVADARARNANRKERASVRAERGTRKLGPTHSDVVGWSHVMLDACGTNSADFLASLIDQVEAATRPLGSQEFAQGTHLNAALAAIDAMEPANEMEAMLLAQMAAAHALAMDMLAQARQTRRADHTATYGSLAMKLMRTYATQVETFAKLRRRGEQTVRVEHVHVHAGGQAIVGNVRHGGGGGAPGETERQSHALDEDAGSTARSLPYAPGTTLRREDPERAPLPLPRAEGEAAVPHARGKGGRAGG
jgi:hypothetical protein